MSSSATKNLADKMRKAVEAKDMLSFSREQFKLVSLCRKFLFRGDKPLLAVAYPDISDLLIWFYRTGKPEWPEADRLMGGVEAVHTLIGDYLATRTYAEVLAEVRSSRLDCRILAFLLEDRDGIQSSDLAGSLGLSQNSLTNRLPGLEKKGLILRTKVGKSSFIYLTPKGKGVAEDLRKEAAGRSSAAAVKKDANHPEFENVLGRMQDGGETACFWPGLSQATLRNLH